MQDSGFALAVSGNLPCSSFHPGFPYFCQTSLRTPIEDFREDSFWPDSSTSLRLDPDLANSVPVSSEKSWRYFPPESALHPSSSLSVYIRTERFYSLFPVPISAFCDQPLP